MSNHQHRIVSTALPPMRKLNAGDVLKPVWATIVGLTTLSLVAISKPVNAFNVTYNFTVEVNSDAYETQGLMQGTTEQGSLTYDDTGLTGSGSEYASPLKGNLTLDFNFLNNKYTEKDDLNYGNRSYAYDYPAAFFTNGKLVGLDFLVVPSQFQPPQDALGFRVYNNAFYVGATDNFNSGTQVGTVTYGDTADLPEPPPPGAGVVAGVPEPSEVGGAIVASFLGAWAMKKVKQKH